jgi:antitoxin component YwqK of YwqJK toxin-antitoxin module
MTVESHCGREYWPNGNLFREVYRKSDGKYHNDSGPAVLYWHENGVLEWEDYYLNGEQHNVAGPAIRHWHENGQLKHE